MPLKAFISLSTNYIKNICSCEKDDILTVWCLNDATHIYRAEFLVLKDSRTFDISYHETGDVFTVSEIKVLSKKDIVRRNFK